MTAPTSTDAATGIAVEDLQLRDGPAVTLEERRFFSDGWQLRAVLVTPATPSFAPRPAVVWSHGWSGAVNHRALPLAARLAQQGYISLALDHRGFGGSEGPRGRCDPAEQVHDVSNAVTYLSTLDAVDSNAVGIAGASFGGAIAVAAAAAEPRLKACVSIVGLADGGQWLQGLRPFYEWYDLRRRIHDDEARRVTTGQGERVDLSLLMPGPQSEAMEAEMALIRGKYPDGYPLENGRLAMRFRPVNVVAAIAPRALCVIGTADDTVVPVGHAEALYERAGEPKELHVFPTGNHGGPLGPLVDETAQVMRAFLGHHLPAAPSGALMASEFPQRLAGRVAIVTGAASGFGRATVERFVAEGASVVLVDLSDDGEAVAKEVDATGERVVFGQADVRIADDVHRVFRQAVCTFGRCDIAVNNAGVLGGGWIHEDGADEHFVRQWEINVGGVWNGCRAALTVMRPEHSGVILNTVSTAALVPNPASPAYGLAKAAVLHLTRSLAVAYGSDGIRVNAVLPGPAITGIFASAGMNVDGLEQRYIENIPLGRVAQTSDIAAAYAYLASDDAAFVTGAALQVDGEFQPRFTRPPAG